MVVQDTSIDFMYFTSDGAEELGDIILSYIKKSSPDSKLVKMDVVPNKKARYVFTWGSKASKGWLEVSMNKDLKLEAVYHYFGGNLRKEENLTTFDKAVKKLKSMVIEDNKELSKVPSF